MHAAQANACVTRGAQVSDTTSMRQEMKRLKDQLQLQTKEIAQLVARQRRRDRVHRRARAAFLLLFVFFSSFFIVIIIAIIPVTIIMIITNTTAGTCGNVFASFRCLQPTHLPPLILQQHLQTNRHLQSAWTSEKLLENGDPALPHEKEGHAELKAEVRIVLGVESCIDAAGSRANDIDSAAAAHAHLLLQGGTTGGKKKETLIDRISKRFQTIERSSFQGHARSDGSGPAVAELMSPPPSSDAAVFQLQQKQVL